MVDTALCIGQAASWPLESVAARVTGDCTARVIGLMHEDGSGQSFIVNAYVSVKGLEGKVVQFYYNARTRTGHLDVA